MSDVYAWRDPFAEIERSEWLEEVMVTDRAKHYRLVDAVSRGQWYSLALAFCLGLLIGNWIP